jgi:serpin B
MEKTKFGLIFILVLVSAISLSCRGEQREVTTATPEEIVLLTDGMISFSFEYFSEIASLNIGKNVCTSPVSLNTALAMLYSGARGNTASEMSKTLYFDENLDLFHGQFKTYYNTLKAMEKRENLDFALANKIYLEKTYPILNSFKTTMKKVYGGVFEIVNFREQPEHSERTINRWVEKTTRNRIKDLIPAGTLDQMTRLVLVNALYINAPWKHQFNENITKKDTFNISPNEKHNTDFMVKEVDGIRYSEFNGNQVIELPYEVPDISLLIILPKNSTKDNIHSFIPTGNEYKTIISDMKPRLVRMEIPKFKIESDFSLKDVLAEMGMPSVFSGDADLSGISGSTDLEADEVLQKVFFEIDEKGTEAAAATAVIIRLTAMPEPQAPILFKADRPFIFILRENTYNTPLFVGYIVKP